MGDGRIPQRADNVYMDSDERNEMDTVTLTCDNCGNVCQTLAGFRDSVRGIDCPACGERGYWSEIAQPIDAAEAFDTSDPDDYFDLEPRADDVPAATLDAEARGRAIAQVAREVASIDPEAFDTAELAAREYCELRDAFVAALLQRGDLSETQADNIAGAVGAYNGTEGLRRALAKLDPAYGTRDDGWAGIDPSERFPIGDNPFDASDRARAASAVRASCERDDWRTS